MQFLFVITFSFTINESGVVLSLDLNVTNDLMPSQVLNAFGSNSDNILFSIV